MFRAFAASKQWERGLFVLTYDEWGGFFDHVRPPVFADDRASPVDVDNFGQAGFRVPTVLASPYARPGFVDHRAYDHTSILRFLEWRFLGAPAEGPVAGTTDRWWLTLRDRHAANIGASLVTASDPELDFDIHADLPLPEHECADVEQPGNSDPGTIPLGPALTDVTANSSSRDPLARELTPPPRVWRVLVP